MNVRRGRVEPQLAAQRLPSGGGAGELLSQLGLDQQFIATAPDERERLLDFPTYWVGLSGRFHKCELFLPRVRGTPRI
jgi:hypothetical protein